VGPRGGAGWEEEQSFRRTLAGGGIYKHSQDPVTLGGFTWPRMTGHVGGGAGMADGQPGSAECQPCPLWPLLLCLCSPILECGAVKLRGDRFLTWVVNESWGQCALAWRRGGSNQQGVWRAVPSPQMNVQFLPLVSPASCH
jgi:hypothetical protein